MIIVKHLQISQILALNNQLNKQNQTTKRSILNFIGSKLYINWRLPKMTFK